MLADFWPQVPADENPVGYITNGVHLPTFLATEWQDAFDRHLGAGWMNRLHDPATAREVEALPDHAFWAVRQELKAQMLQLVRQRIRSSTCATRAANRTSTACCATRIRPTRTCSPSASRAASRPTSARRCCSRISTCCARSWAIASGP